MTKTFFIFVLFSFYLVSSHVALGLMPPLTDEELKSQTNVIVDGEITNVACAGFRDNTHECMNLTGYQATLKLLKIYKQGPLKQKVGDTVTLVFNKYDFKNGCVGSPDTEHYQGEQAKYFLICTAESNCRLTHWNGIEIKKEGNQPLPSCP